MWHNGDVPVSLRSTIPISAARTGWQRAAMCFSRATICPRGSGTGFTSPSSALAPGSTCWPRFTRGGRRACRGGCGLPRSRRSPCRRRTCAGRNPGLPISPIAAELAPRWTGGAQEIVLPDLEFTLVTGDARDTLSHWPNDANAWFLDGFSPAKNPELWQPELMTEVARHTAPGGTAATYTAAGFVRRGLEAAGFSVSRMPGYGRKRHMTRATLDRP